MLSRVRDLTLLVALLCSVGVASSLRAELPSWYVIPFDPNAQTIAELRHLEFFGVSEREYLERCSDQLARSRHDPHEQARLYEARGDVYSYFGQFDEALQDYETAGQLDSTNSRIQCSEARVKAARGDEDTAIAECIAIVKASPDCVAACDLLAMIYSKQGKAVEAIDFATRAISLSATVATPYLWRATAYLDLGQTEQALRDFDTFIAMCPAGIPRNEDLAYYAKASLLAQKGLLNEALETYRLAWRLNPDSYKTLQNLRVIYQATGQYALSRAAAERMGALDPDNLKSSIALSQSRLETKDFELARKPAEDWVERQPESHYARLVLASVCVSLRDYDSAWTHYDAALTLAPDSYDVHIASSLFLSTCPAQQFRNGEQAAALVQRARSILNGEPDESWHVARIAATAALGDRESAISILQERVATDGISPELRLQYDIMAKHLQVPQDTAATTPILLHTLSGRVPKFTERTSQRARR
jgi:tetratricopeptide (TPR) repeat protein